MNKKVVGLLSLGISLAAIAYVTYNSLAQLKDIDYDLFDIEEDIDTEE
jgi:hypothetical protein